VLTINPSGATMTITVSAGGTSAATGGQLSIVPVNPQPGHTGGGDVAGPTATVTVTVGLLTTTTTAYFISESPVPTVG
jgi:hypothetical protein